MITVYPWGIVNTICIFIHFKNDYTIRSIEKIVFDWETIYKKAVTSLRIYIWYFTHCILYHVFHSQFRVKINKSQYTISGIIDYLAFARQHVPSTIRGYKQYPARNPKSRFLNGVSKFNWRLTIKSFEYNHALDNICSMKNDHNLWKILFLS